MYKKLLSIQQKIGKISKDSTNPFYNSKYFDINSLLEALKPLLNEEGLVVTQPLTHVDGKPAIMTKIMDEDKSYSETIVLPENNDPQKMGSAITYYRRYALQSMFLLQAEDDDGNKASTGYSQPVNTPVQKSTTTTASTLSCDGCKGTNVKHMVGTSKKTGKGYNFYACQDPKCKFTWNN